MTSIHYLAGRTVDARQEILAERLSSWSGGPVLHLVPARGRVIELESEHRFWLKKRQDTLKGLIYRIFEDHIRFRRFKDFRQIDPEVRVLIVRKAMERRTGGPDGLVCFNSLLQDREGDFPGIFRSIADFFSMLTVNNYQDRFVNDLQARIIRAEDKGGMSGNGPFSLESDLAWLFGDFEEIKREIRAYDIDDVLSSVRDLLGSGAMPYPLRDTDVIILDGFIHLSRIEEDILYHLFGHVKEVWWLLDYHGQGHVSEVGLRQAWGEEKDRRSGMDAYRILAPMTSFMDRLKAGGYETILEKAGDGPFNNPVAQGLYTDGRPDGSRGNCLRIRAFPEKVDEVRGIASEIKRIIHDDGLDTVKDLGRIRIIFPDLMDYSALVCEIFREYNIPFSLTGGMPLVLHPLTDVFLLIFKIPLNGFKRADIFRLFSSGPVRKDIPPDRSYDYEGLMKILEDHLLAGDDTAYARSVIPGYASEDPLSHGLDIYLIDRISRKCGINSLYDHATGIDRGISVVKDYYNGMLIKTGAASENGGLRREYYRFIIQYYLLSGYLNALKGLEARDAPQDMERSYMGLLKDLGLPRNLLDASCLQGSSGSLGDSVMLKRDLKTYDLLRDIVSASASEMSVENELFREGTGRDLLSRFYRSFIRRLEKTFLLDEQDPNVIRISQWLEIRGRSFDYVFSGGLTDKRFPLREETNFICPETCRINFRVQDNIDLSRHLLSHLLRNCRKGLYLSYPTYVDGKEVRPSDIFTDIDSMMTNGGTSAPPQVGFAETYFKWDNSPYISSDREMLDADIKKCPRHEAHISETSISLKDIIIKDASMTEGIIRALRAVVSRSALNGLFDYDGLVQKAGRFETFLRSKKDIFSSSQLDTLANCPMRYLFERVYRLETMDTAGPEASPVDTGAHIHGILKIFFKRLAQQGVNIGDIGIEKAFDQAMSAAEEYLKSVPFLNSIEFFEHQRQEFLAGLASGVTGPGSSREGPFALMLRFEEESFRDRKPEGIEYEFGYNEAQYPRLGRVMLRGVIDRFDRGKNDNGTIHIYDYKTGKTPSATLIKKGLSFQLPVYIRAVKTCLSPEKTTAALYGLKRDSFSGKGPLGQYISENAGDSAGLDITGVSIPDMHADRLMEMIERGRFHHSTDMEKCGHCDFRHACHRDERRMTHLLASEKDHGIYSGESNLRTWKIAEDFMTEWKKTREKMQKALTLKTATGRKNNYESVLAFGEGLDKTRDSLPFESWHIDRLIKEISDFKNRYLSVPGN